MGNVASHFLPQFLTILGALLESKLSLEELKTENVSRLGSNSLLSQPWVDQP